MLIVCPSCASEYTIDAEHVGAEGRSVRCAACRATWFISADDVVAAVEADLTAAMTEAVRGRAETANAEAPVEAPEAPPTEPPAFEAEPPTAPLDDAEAEPRPRPKRVPPVKPARRPRFSPAFALGLSVVVGLGLAVAGRTTVVRAMPQSAGLYARMGLPVNLRGLDLRDVTAFQTQGDGAQLVIEGDVVGVAEAGAPVPPIEIEVRDAHEQVLYRWSVAAPRQSLEHRETARFRASLSAPPAEGRAIRVGFAPKAGTP